MKTVKLSFFLFVTFFFACQTNKSQTIEIVTKKDIKDVIAKEVQLVDVRTAKEYQAGHIENAINYNIGDKKVFLTQIETLDKNKPVYLYCKIGGRSSRAAKILKEKGFIKIYDYAGGYNDWVK